MTLFAFSANAQKINGLVFEDLVLQKVRERALPLDSVTGFTTERLLAELACTTGAKRKLVVDPPEVRYTRIDSGGYERRIATMVSFVDSSEVGYELTHIDTLSKSGLRIVRKGSVLELRGEDPRWGVRYLLPIAIIGTGIAGIISLFYLRSS